MLSDYALWLLNASGHKSDPADLPTCGGAASVAPVFFRAADVAQDTNDMAAVLDRWRGAFRAFTDADAERKAQMDAITIRIM